MTVLHKVRVGDFAGVVRAVYADEDFSFLDQYGTDSNGLDLCVQKAIENIGNAIFFKVENEFGALVGFFTVDLQNLDVIPNLHVRNYKAFRTDEYLAAFWALINETYNNSFFTSIGAANFPPGYSGLKNSFTINNNHQTDAVNFLILKLITP
jgi:hypothetical protein